MAAEKKPRLFVVPLFMAEGVCWNTAVCGHGLVGGIDLGNGLGAGIPCVRPAAECPRFKGEIDEPFGTISEPDGEERPIFIRALRETGP